MNKKVLIIVEGSDDLSLYGKLFDDVTIMYSNGVQKLIEIVENLYNSYKDDFIAIKDADFDILENHQYHYDNMFMTDTHDLETMLIDEHSVGSIVSEEVSEPFKEFKSIDEIINFIVSSLEKYSYIKWFNDINKCNINFECIKITDLFENNKLNSLDDILTILYSKDCNKKDSVTTIMKDSITDFKNNSICDDKMLLINGHDFCDLFAYWVKSKGKDKNINGKKIAQFLRIEYSRDKFMKTKLYKSVNVWNDKHKIKIIDY